MFYLVSLRYSSAIEEGPIKSYNKIGIFSFEAYEMLNFLMGNEEWCNDITAAIDSSLDDLVINLGKTEMNYACGLGALGFLAIASRGHSELDNYF